MPKKTYDDLPTVDLNGVEIFAEGNWNGDKYSGDDLQAMVDAFNKVGFEPTIKAGHADGQDDEKQARRVFGAPALGYVKRIYRNGTKLIADITKVPRKFADLIKAGSYKRVSSEIYWNYRDDSQDKTFPRVLKSVAFLGAEIPALTNLTAIQALFHKRGTRVFAYQKGHEYRLYDMDNDNDNDMSGSGDNDNDAAKKCSVKQDDNGKYCVYDGMGNKLGEYDDQGSAQAACDAKNKGYSHKQNFADYPWDQCIADQLKAGHDENSAKQICGSIKAKNNSKGEIEMDVKELEAKLEAMKLDLIKEYGKKTEDAVSQVKAEAETEKAKLYERISQLEKMNEENAEVARKAKIDTRLHALKGKISKVEENKLRAIFSTLPDTLVRTYSEDGKEVKENVVEAIWKLFEGRTGNVMRELTANDGEETKSYANAQAEIIAKANEFIAKDEKLTLQQAYQKVSKADPELWKAYQLEVKGAH